MTFSDALAFTLEEERGFANDPADPGGPTMDGVTQRVYDGWRDAHRLPRRSVREIAAAEREVIYEQQYWWTAACDRVERASRPLLAVCVFDWAVNGSAARARIYLQLAVGADPDGIVGPLTLAEVAACSEHLACAHYLSMRRLHHVARAGDVSARSMLASAGVPEKYLPHPDPTQGVFLPGWLARVKRLAVRVGLDERAIA